MPRPHFTKMVAMLALWLAGQSSAAAAGPLANDLRTSASARHAAVCHAPDYLRGNTLRTLFRDAAVPVRDDSGRLPDEAPLPRRQHRPAGEARPAAGAESQGADVVAALEAGWSSNPDARAIEGFLVETLRLRRERAGAGGRDE